MPFSFPIAGRQQNGRRPGQARLFVRGLCHKHPGRSCGIGCFPPGIRACSGLLPRHNGAWRILLPISRLAGKSLPVITYRAYKYTSPPLPACICGMLALAALSFALQPGPEAFGSRGSFRCYNTGWGSFTCLCPAFVTNEMLLLLAGLVGVSFAVHSV